MESDSPTIRGLLDSQPRDEDNRRTVKKQK